MEVVNNNFFFIYNIGMITIREPIMTPPNGYSVNPQHQDKAGAIFEDGTLYFDKLQFNGKFVTIFPPKFEANFRGERIVFVNTKILYTYEADFENNKFIITFSAAPNVMWNGASLGEVIRFIDVEQ